MFNTPVLEESLDKWEHPGTNTQYTEEGPEGEVEQTLLTVRELIDSTISRHRTRSAESHLLTLVQPNAAALEEEIGRLIGQAKLFVDLALSAKTVREQGISSALRRIGTGFAGRARVRVLCDPGVLDRELVRACSSGEQQAEIRLTGIPLQESLIVDGRSALVRSAAPTGCQSWVVRAPGVIQALHSLYVATWRRAVPLADQVHFNSRTSSQTARQVLIRLHLGLTDDTAARELSMSVRTYRRYVADIMRALGASSRFQAGVRATQLGLLPEAGSGMVPGPARRTRGYAAAAPHRSGTVRSPGGNFL